MRQNAIRLIIILIGLYTISGCGFQLRGHCALPQQLRLLYIQSNDPYGSFTKQLKQAFLARNTILTCSASRAPVTLDILSDAITHQTSSISASTQLIQYQLTYTVIYQLLDRFGRVIQPPQMISTTRTYSVNINQMLAGGDAQAQLAQEMRRDVIFQLMTRLCAPNTLRALNCAYRL